MQDETSNNTYKGAPKRPKGCSAKKFCHHFFTTTNFITLIFRFLLFFSFGDKKERIRASQGQLSQVGVKTPCLRTIKRRRGLKKSPPKLCQPFLKNLKRAFLIPSQREATPIPAPTQGFQKPSGIATAPKPIDNQPHS